MKIKKVPTAAFLAGVTTLAVSLPAVSAERSLYQDPLDVFSGAGDHYLDLEQLAARLGVGMTPAQKGRNKDD